MTNLPSMLSVLGAAHTSEIKLDLKGDPPQAPADGAIAPDPVAFADVLARTASGNAPIDPRATAKAPSAPTGKASKGGADQGGRVDPLSARSPSLAPLLREPHDMPTHDEPHASPPGDSDAKRSVPSRRDGPREQGELLDGETPLAARSPMLALVLASINQRLEPDASAPTLTLDPSIPAPTVDPKAPSLAVVVAPTSARIDTKSPSPAAAFDPPILRTNALEARATLEGAPSAPTLLKEPLADPAVIGSPRIVTADPAEIGVTANAGPHRLDGGASTTPRAARPAISTPRAQMTALLASNDAPNQAPSGMRIARGATPRRSDEPLSSTPRSPADQHRASVEASAAAALASQFASQFAPTAAASRMIPAPTAVGEEQLARAANAIDPSRATQPLVASPPSHQSHDADEPSVRAQDITHVRLSPSPNANDPSATTRHGLGPQSSAAEASRAERTAPPQFTTQSASGSELEGDSPPEADPTMSRAARPRDALEASIAQDGIAHAPLTRSAPSATREPHLEVGEGPANAPRAATTADDANILPQQTPALHELRERVATTTRAGDDDSRLERASRAEHAHAASPERHAAASRDATAIAKAMPIESLRADEAPRPSALQAPSRREEHHATAELASARASLRTTAHAEIDLPDLGHVAVRADKRAGQVDVSVVARAEDAAALLQASRHDLAAHLRSADIRLGSLSVGSGGAGAPRDDRRQGGAPDRDATTGHDLDVSADGGAPHKRVRAVI